MFAETLAHMLAHGPVTVTKVGRSVVITSKEKDAAGQEWINKFPDSMLPSLAFYKDEKKRLSAASKRK